MAKERPSIIKIAPGAEIDGLDMQGNVLDGDIDAINNQGKLKNVIVKENVLTTSQKSGRAVIPRTSKNFVIGVFLIVSLLFLFGYKPESISIGPFSYPLDEARNFSERHLSGVDKECIEKKLSGMEAQYINLEQRAKFVASADQNGSSFFAQEPSNEVKAFTNEVKTFLESKGYGIDPYMTIGAIYDPQEVSFEGVSIEPGDQPGEVLIIIGENNGTHTCSL